MMRFGVAALVLGAAFPRWFGQWSHPESSNNNLITVSVFASLVIRSFEISWLCLVLCFVCYARYFLEFSVGFFLKRVFFTLNS